MAKEFGTTLAVYERLFGSGRVKDLFEHGDGPVQEGVDATTGQDTVSFAQQVMNENTNQLEPEAELKKHKKQREEAEQEQSRSLQQDGKGKEEKEKEKEKSSYKEVKERIGGFVSRFRRKED